MLDLTVVFGLELYLGLYGLESLITKLTTHIISRPS